METHTPPLWLGNTATENIHCNKSFSLVMTHKILFSANKSANLQTCRGISTCFHWTIQLVKKVYLNYSMTCCRLRFKLAKTDHFHMIMSTLRCHPQLVNHFLVVFSVSFRFCLIKDFKFCHVTSDITSGHNLLRKYTFLVRFQICF